MISRFKSYIDSHRSLLTDALPNMLSWIISSICSFSTLFLLIECVDNKRVIYMARYRSGHNGAVLKTVGGDEPSVGSNPTRAAMPFHMLTLDRQVDESETNYAGRLSTGWRAVESKLFSSILERVGKLGPVVAAEKYPKTIGVKTCFIGDSLERQANILRGGQVAKSPASCAGNRRCKSCPLQPLSTGHHLHTTIKTA